MLMDETPLSANYEMNLSGFQAIFQATVLEYRCVWRLYVISDLPSNSTQLSRASLGVTTERRYSEQFSVRYHRNVVVLCL